MSAEPTPPSGLSKEYRLTCEKCRLDRITSARPKIGSFHWSQDGKCSAQPFLEYRFFGEWNPIFSELPS